MTYTLILTFPRLRREKEGNNCFQLNNNICLFMEIVNKSVRSFKLLKKEEK